MKRLAAALLLLTTVPAAPQSAPYVYQYTLSTTAVTVLPPNPRRKRIMMFNPNPAAMLALCPIGPARGPPNATVVAAVNGAGCETMLPYGQLVVDGGIASGALMSATTSWIAISDTPGSAFTAWEFE